MATTKERVARKTNLESKPGESEMAEANALVNGDRQASYGSPRGSYEAIAKVWSGILWPILRREITPEEAALMMVGLKVQREANRPKRDNRVDAHGYLLVLSHIIEGAPNNNDGHDNPQPSAAGAGPRAR